MSGLNVTWTSGQPHFQSNLTFIDAMYPEGPDWEMKVADMCLK